MNLQRHSITSQSSTSKVWQARNSKTKSPSSNISIFPQILKIFHRKAPAEDMGKIDEDYEVDEDTEKP
jgi:hypothetical protein